MPKTFSWTTEMEQKALDLRVNHSLGWEAIQRLLGCPTKDVPRIKVNRLLRHGVKPPKKGKYQWDLSKLPIELIPQTLVGDVADSKLPYEVESPFSRNPYVFTGDQYIFAVNGETIAFPKKAWEDILAAYAVKGGDLTQYEVAQKFGMNKKVLEACLKLYGHFKARPPVSREALAEAHATGSTEPLMKQVIEVAEHSFDAALDQRYAEHYRKEHQKLREKLADAERLVGNMRELVRETLVDDLPSEPPEVVKRKFKGAATAVFHLPYYDIHVGEFVQSELGWGGEYNTDLACEYLRRSATAAAEAIHQKVGRAETLHVTFGGDVFHAMMGQTKSGKHRLDRDQNDRLIFRKTVRAALDTIQTLRAVTERIVVRVIPGNHDHIFAELFEETIAAYLIGQKGVDIPNEVGKRKFFLIGDSMHLLDHGEKFTAFSAKAMVSAQIMARKVGASAWQNTQRVYCYVGHTHHRETKAHDGYLELIRVPTFAPPGEYAEGLALSNEQEVPLYQLDWRGRIAGETRLYLTDWAP